MSKQLSTLSKLRDDLKDIEEGLAELVSISPVKWFNRDDGFLTVVGGADYYFKDPNADQLRLQVPLKSRYDKWLARFSLLYRNPPSDLGEKIKSANEALAKWIDLGGRNYDVTPQAEVNAIAARKACEPFYELLDLLDTRGEVIVVPDTNAIIAAPEPQHYSSVAESASFTFLLLPTVLAELDNLKNSARAPEFREKVGGVIRRIKGWRKQGKLSEGVVLHKTITVRAIAEEPNMRETLGWLDPLNRDDRIIASVLEVQVTAPAAHVILVTGDINLQNKAEAAKLHYAEIPDPAEVL